MNFKFQSSKSDHPTPWRLEFPLSSSIKHLRCWYPRPSYRQSVGLGLETLRSESRVVGVVEMSSCEEHSEHSHMVIFFVGCFNAHAERISQKKTSVDSWWKNKNFWKVLEIDIKALSSLSLGSIGLLCLPTWNRWKISWETGSCIYQPRINPGGTWNRGVKRKKNMLKSGIPTPLVGGLNKMQGKKLGEV